MSYSNKTMSLFNKSGSVFLISPYPNKGEIYSPGKTGVAAYAKNMVKHLGKKVIVMADYEKRPQSYKEGNSFVLRCFKINTLKIWINIYKKMRLFPNVKEILIHLDFGMYGLLPTMLSLVFFFFLKLAHYRVYVVNHHVVSDIGRLSGHVGLGKGPLSFLKKCTYNGFFHLFYFALGIVSEKIIVLEEPLQSKMERFVKKGKTVTVPFHVDTNLKPMDKWKARKKLGYGKNEYVVMFFGFVNWFKGADIFAESFANTETILGKKSRFVIAGGKSSTMNNKKYYRDYFNKVTTTVENSKRVEITGYIPQKDIKTYFSACDLVVFPYREFMCASAVLSLVFSYKKVFAISKELMPMFQSDDFTEALSKTGLNIHDITFDLTKESIIDRVTNILKNGTKKKVIGLTEIMQEKRSFKNNVVNYHLLLKQSPSKQAARSYGFTHFAFEGK